MITIKKYAKADCTPCKIVAAYLRSESEYITEQNIEVEEIDIMTDLTEAERQELPFTSVPVIEFYRNGVLMATSYGLNIPDEFRDCVEIAKEAK